MAVDGSLIFDTGLDSGGFEADLNGITSSATTAGAAIVATFATITVAASAAAAEIGMAYESAFAGVKKTVNETASITYADISTEIRNMAKNDMPAAASSISAVAEAAGQLGIATKDITNFSEVMINLGEATNLSADIAASSLAKFANITQMDASNYENLGSTIVALGNNFATTEADIVSMSMRLASAGTTAKMSETDILGFSTAMSSVGIEAEAGGSAMSTFIKRMQTAVETGEGLEDFAEIAGMTAEAFTNLWNSNAAGAVTAFIGNLNNVEQHGRSAVQILDEMGMTEIRLSNTLLALANSGDLMTRAINLSNEAWEENVALSEEVEKRYATTESIMNITKNNLADIGITVYDKFQQPLVSAFEAATDGLQEFNDNLSNGELSGKLDKVADSFEKLSVVAVEFITTEAFPSMINGMAWIVDNGNTLISEIAGVAGAVISFKVATEGAAAAQALFNGLAKTNPYILIGSAIVGLITTIATLSATEKKHYEIMAQGTGKYDEQIEAVEKLSEAYNDVKEASQDIIDSQEDEIRQLKEMKRILDNNVDAQGRVIGDYETVKMLIEEINGIYPEEISLINGKIEKYDELTLSMDEYIQKLREEALYEAKYDSWKQAVVTYDQTSAQNDELQNNLEEAKAAADDAKKKYEWFKSGINRYTAGDQRRAEEAGKTVKQYLADMYYSTAGDYEAAKTAYEQNLALMEQSKAEMDEFESMFSKNDTVSYSLGASLYGESQKAADKAYADARAKEAEEIIKARETATEKLQEKWEELEHEYASSTTMTEEELYA